MPLPEPCLDRQTQLLDEPRSIDAAACLCLDLETGFRRIHDVDRYRPSEELSTERLAGDALPVDRHRTGQARDRRPEAINLQVAVRGDEARHERKIAPVLDVHL